MLDNILGYRILRHILYWIGIVVAYAIYAKGFGMAIYDSVIIKLCFLPGQILASYFLIYYQIPQLIYKKRYGLFMLTFLMSIWFFPALAHFADDYLVNFFFDRPEPKQHTLLEIISDPILAYYQIAAFLIPSVTVAIKIVKDRFEEKQAIDALEQEKTHAELQLLKAQIHPHFLFKTLDHLYELTLQKSDLAPEIVVKLSEMLDFMLYQGQNQKVPLRKEIELLRHYLDLQVLQYGNEFTYQFQEQPNHVNPAITPLTLLSMLEIGLKQKQKGPIAIEIQLEANTEHIHFRISVDHVDGKEENWKDFLWQLSVGYPNKHTFETSKEGSTKTFDLLLNS